MSLLTSASDADVMMQNVKHLIAQHGKECVQHSKEALLHGKEALLHGKEALIQGRGKDMKEFVLQRTESLQHGKDYLAEKIANEKLPNLPVDRVRSVLRIGQQGLEQVTEGTFMVNVAFFLPSYSQVF